MAGLLQFSLLKNFGTISQALDSLRSSAQFVLWSGGHINHLYKTSTYKRQPQDYMSLSYPTCFTFPNPMTDWLYLKQIFVASAK